MRTMQARHMLRAQGLRLSRHPKGPFEQCIFQRPAGWSDNSLRVANRSEIIVSVSRKSEKISANQGAEEAAAKVEISSDGDMWR